jgi:cell division transport system permease protein
MKDLSPVFEQHKRAIKIALSDLFRRPLASLMTILVLAIALALPATLLALLNLGEQLTSEWSSERTVTLFLKSDTDAEAALLLSATIEEMEGVDSTELRTSADALAEFRLYSGFGDALDALEENPLPNHILIRPSESSDNDAIKLLVNSLATLPESDLVEYDQAWVERLNSFTETARRFADALAAALAIAIAMIIGNTIRLEIATRHSEIEITRLVGGTDGFIRRPFLYTGMLYGFSGALLGWLLVSLLLLFLKSPLHELETLYATSLPLRPFDLQRLALLLPAGILLGMLGAALTVGRHLVTIQPE